MECRSRPVLCTATNPPVPRKEPKRSNSGTFIMAESIGIERGSCFPILELKLPKPASPASVISRRFTSL